VGPPGFDARGSDPLLIAVLSFAPAAFGLGHFALVAIRITVIRTAIADPRVPGEPFMQTAARRTAGTAEEDRHGVEGCTVHAQAGGNGFLRIRASNHEDAHFVLLGREPEPNTAKYNNRIPFSGRSLSEH